MNSQDRKLLADIRPVVVGDVNHSGGGPVTAVKQHDHIDLVTRFPAGGHPQVIQHAAFGDSFNGFVRLRFCVCGKIRQSDTSPFCRFVEQVESVHPRAVRRHLQPSLVFETDILAINRHATTGHRTGEFAPTVCGKCAGDFRIVLFHSHWPPRSHPVSGEVGRLGVLGIRVNLPATPEPTVSATGPLTVESQTVFRSFDGQCSPRVTIAEIQFDFLRDVPLHNAGYGSAVAIRAADSLAFGFQFHDAVVGNPLPIPIGRFIGLRGFFGGAVLFLGPRLRWHMKDQNGDGGAYCQTVNLAEFHRLPRVTVDYFCLPLRLSRIDFAWR